MGVHEETPVRQCTFTVLVENHAGVLSRIAGLFSARGYNIDSLAVGETHDPTLSRMTIVSHGDEKTLEQIKKQLNKLIDTIKVQDLTDEDFIERELMLIKLKASPKAKEVLEKFSKDYQLWTVDENPKVLTAECVETRANAKKIFDIFNKELEIVEVARTGTVALSKKLSKD